MSEINRLVLHAGGPKTGSGAIQKFYQKLKKSKSNISDRLEFSFLSDQSSFNLGKIVNQIFKGNFRYSLEEFLSVSSGSVPDNCSTLIFSAERAGAPGQSDVRSNNLSRFLKSLYPVTVLYYVRPTMSLSLSLYLQTCKASGTFNSNDLIKNLTRNQYGVATLVERFNHLYGVENVQIIPFKRELLACQDIRVDFAKRLNSDKDVVEALARVANKTPSPGGQVDFQMLNILKSIYTKNMVTRNNKTPRLFNQFCTDGSWAGDKVIHTDVFTNDEIKALHETSVAEFEKLISLGLQADPPNDLSYYLKERKISSSDIYQMYLSEWQKQIFSKILLIFQSSEADHELTSALSHYSNLIENDAAIDASDFLSVFFSATKLLEKMSSFKS
jgi:hypothetical protein